MRGRGPYAWLIALLVATSAFTQGLPPLEAVVEIRRTEMRAGTTTAVEYVDLGGRLATQEEIEAVVSGDQDEDGVSNLLDACPLNPYCQDPAHLVDADSDGFPAWQDIDDQDAGVRLTGNPDIDDRDTTDELTEPLALFDSGEAVVEWFLTENAAKELYSQEQAVVLAEQAGFDPAQIQDWRERFLEPPPEPGCRECLDGVLSECQQGCVGVSGRKRWACVLKCKARRKKECKQLCKAERKQLKGEIKELRREVKKQLKASGRPPRAKPKGGEPGLIQQLFQQLAEFWTKLRSLKGWW